MRYMQFLAPLLLFCTLASAEVKPLPPSQRPTTVAGALPLIIAALSISQNSIVRGTSKDSLPLLQGEWGEDIQQLLGLTSGNSALHHAACGPSCTVDQATLVLMEAAWAALQK